MADYPMNSRAYTQKRLSNYEGFKRLDAMLEKVDAGKLKPPREPMRDFLCEVCSRRKRSVRAVPCLTMGKKLVGTKLKGLFVLVCDDGPGSCAAALERAGVPQKAAEQNRRMLALGLVIP
jgi:hypothetical protein